jgi:hypothetical protein
VAFIANPFFPIWNLRHRATNVAHTRIAVLLFVPEHSELNYLRATLPTQRHAVPTRPNHYRCSNLVQCFREGTEESAPLISTATVQQ